MKKIAITLAAYAFSVSAANADMPGRHPHYLHALADLRAAHWLIEHRPGDETVVHDEEIAISEIEAAFADIRHAAIDDGKDIHAHESIDVPADFHARFHQALDRLRSAHDDVAHEEDDPAAQGLRNRSLAHIDVASNAIQQASNAARRDR